MSNFAQVIIDPKTLREELERKWQKEFEDWVRPKKQLVSLEELEMMYGKKRATLEIEFLQDPRVKLHERRRGPKAQRYWLYEPTVKAIQEIMDEW